MSGWGITLDCLGQSKAAAVPPIYRIDLTSLNRYDAKDSPATRRAWDTLHVAASIQGLVNRSSANLFLRITPEVDDFWWNYLRGEQGWLKNRPVLQIEGVSELVRIFLPQLKGVVLYNENVPATANLASTVAGAEDRIALRYDSSPGSLYSQLVLQPGFLANVLKLFREDGSPLFTGRGKIPGTTLDSTGSAKNDAYWWAKLRYLDAGRCSRDYLAYYIDSYWLAKPGRLSTCTLANHDFFISQRAFFFDLGMWADETPIDDRSQKPGTDVGTLKAILKSMYLSGSNRIFTVGGFVPWERKYCGPSSDSPGWGGSGGTHSGVQSEWEYARIISAYNAIMDADAAGFADLANASFYQHFPLKKQYAQNPKPAIADLKARGLIQPNGSVKPAAYVAFYMGDYDSSAWLCRFAPTWWADPEHGKTPCNWAFNPNLDRRTPQVMDYVRTHRTAADWFISGDSGAGYLNPGMLSAPRLDPAVPDGWAAWTQYNQNYFSRYDLTITGFIIEGFAPFLTQRGFDEYAKFSPDGMMIGTGNNTFGLVGLHGGQVPCIRHQMDLNGTPSEAGAKVAARIAAGWQGAAGETQFFMPRTILKSPTWHAKTMAAAQAAPGGDRIQFVDAYTFFLLLRTHLLEASPNH